MAKITCQCGAQLGRPIPNHCPACGAVIRGIRRRGLGPTLSALIAIAMFVAIVCYALWMAGVL